jgi:aminopeptidase S
VAALLEAADALGSRPDRRVRLAFWGAEELGLVGSRHYVRALTREQRDEIAAYLNFDMGGLTQRGAGGLRRRRPAAHAAAA